MSSRMFKGLKTWNPFFGCEHHCYRDGCWAKKRLAHRLGEMLPCPLCFAFKPHFHEERLSHIPSEPCIFVVGHGDLFGKWVPSYIIVKILEVCKEKPKKEWFFETKNPERYLEFVSLFPNNTTLSTTIETNRDYPTEIRGYTPTPETRFKVMKLIGEEWSRYRLHISIEPIMDFDFDILLSWIKELQPNKIAVGYDSLKNGLPEPPKTKTLRLIEELEKFTNVERKQL